MKREIGSRLEPSVFTEAANDLAVVIDQERRRRGLGIYAMGELLGFSKTHTAKFSRYLRGDSSEFGYLSAARVAERLGIPMLMLVGDEAKLPPPTPVVSIAQPVRRQTRRAGPPPGQLALPFDLCAA